MNGRRQTAGSDDNGQAIVEFIVGLVVVLALFAGLLQVAGLTRAHTDAMVEARREAGELAMQELGGGMNMLYNPDYILDRLEGADEKRHTRDDAFSSANPTDFQGAVTDRAVVDQSDWSIIGGSPSDGISSLHDSLTPASELGLVRGHDAGSVALLPAVRHLLYDAESINVECEVWMTWTKGIY